jgi:MT-A70
MTSPMLECAFPVIKAWGFDYKASFVWDKVKHNMGHYNSVRCEYLLVATRGSCTPDVAKLFDNVISIERTSHSAKPPEFRHMIDTLYPYGNRLELFAREKAKRWQAWGAEAPTPSAARRLFFCARALPVRPIHASTGGERPRRDTMTITIDSEFKNLTARLQPDELAQLEANLMAEGCRDPLVTWHGILIDGHNRYEICERRGIKYRTVEVALASRDHVLLWIEENQLGRRNISEDMRIALADSILERRVALALSETSKTATGHATWRRMSPPRPVNGRAPPSQSKPRSPNGGCISTGR